MSGGCVKRTTLALATAVTILLIILVTSAWPNPPDGGQIIFTSYSSKEAAFYADAEFACSIPSGSDSGVSCKFATTRGIHDVVAVVGTEKLPTEKVLVDDEISPGYGDRLYQGVCQVSATNSFSCSNGR
jgi:hypothetical protein